MNTEQLAVREFMVAARQELPDRPTIPSLAVRILRAKLMLEETLETIVKGLGVDLVNPDGLSLINLMRLSHAPWTELHSGNLIEIADGCADVKVVTDGTALACGIDLEPIFAEVHRSNMSKFIDGSFREDGKYVKGPSYSKPNLGPILETQVLAVSGGSGLRQKAQCGIGPQTEPEAPSRASSTQGGPS